MLQIHTSGALGLLLLCLCVWGHRDVCVWDPVNDEKRALEVLADRASQFSGSESELVEKGSWDFWWQAQAST